MTKYIPLILGVFLASIILIFKFTESPSQYSEVNGDIEDIKHNTKNLYDLVDKVQESTHQKSDKIHKLDSLVDKKNITIQEYSKQLKQLLFKAEEERDNALKQKERAENIRTMAIYAEQNSKLQRNIAEEEYHKLKIENSELKIQLIKSKEILDTTPPTIDTIPNMDLDTKPIKKSKNLFKKNG